MSEYKKKQIYSQACHISLTAFNYLYTLSVFNSCTDNVSASLEWGRNEAVFINIFSSIVMLGLTLGSLFAAHALNRFGRRLSLIYCNIAFIIGSLILVMPHTIAFGIGRAITSLSLGVSSTVAPVFIIETSPILLIPSVGPILTVSGSIGMLFANSFSLFLPYENFSSDSNNRLWIFLFLFPALISLYQLFYFMIFQKLDSPQFYLSKDMRDKAHAAIRYTHFESGIEAEMRRVESEVKGAVSGNKKLTLSGMIKKKKFRKMIRVGSIMLILQQLSGTTAIMFYSTKIFNNINKGLLVSRVVTALLGLVNILGSVASLLFIHRFGRKPIIISSMILIGMNLVLLGIFSEYYLISISAPVAFLIFYRFCTSYGLNSVFTLYMSEILNDQIYVMTSTLNYLAGILVASLFPIAMNSVGLAPSLFFFATWMILGSVYSFFELVETKGRDKETILIEMKVVNKEKKVVPADDDLIRVTEYCNPYENEKISLKESS